MYIVLKGKDRISTPDKESAKKIVQAMNDMDSYESISIRNVEGLTEKTDTYALEFNGYTVDVSGKDSALMLSLWVLMLNGKSILITRKEGE